MKKIIILASITISIFCMEPPIVNAYDSIMIASWNEACKDAEQCKMNPLSHIVRRQNSTQYIIEYALSHQDLLSVDVNLQDANTLMTPLHWACMSPDGKFINRLCNLPTINVNIQEEEGYTPLHLACVHSRDLIDKRVDILLATGKFNFSLGDKQGKNIIEFTCDNHEKWWETCEDNGLGWSSMEIERLIGTREVTMHKILCATAQPIQCALIKAMLLQEGVKNNERIALLPKIQGLIMYLIYALNIDLIIARTYKPEYLTENYWTTYYCHMKNERQRLKENMIQSPTKKNIRLLWEKK